MNEARFRSGKRPRSLGNTIDRVRSDRRAKSLQ